MKAKFDSVDKGWFSIYYTGLDIISKTSESLIKSGFLNYSLTSYNEYKVPYEQMKNSLSVSSDIFLEECFGFQLNVSLSILLPVF